MLKLVDKHLKKDNYSIEDICKELGIDEEEIIQNYLTRLDGSEIKLSDYSFKSHSRCYHVFSETLRVQKFINSKDIKELGKLMNESHYSLRDDFECSCNELEIITKLCRELGALGSRLTGAGWGGCNVSLVEDHKVDDFVKELSEKFYKGNKSEILISNPSIGELNREHTKTCT